MATQSGLVARMVAAPAPQQRLCARACRSRAAAGGGGGDYRCSLYRYSRYYSSLRSRSPAYVAYFSKSTFLFLRSRKTCFKYPYVVKYTPNSVTTPPPSVLVLDTNLLTPSLRAIFFKLSIVLIYVESLSVDTCNLVFKTSKGQTITAAIAPDVAPDAVHHTRVR